MIVDNIKNSQVYLTLNLGFEKAFEFLRNCLEQVPETGKHIIDGNLVYANVMQYETKAANELRWEAHKDYLDIQFIVAGNEKIGYADVNDLIEPTSYNAEKDCILADTARTASWIKLFRGQFAILWPQDAHQPKCQDDDVSDVLKVVVKVKI